MAINFFSKWATQGKLNSVRIPSTGTHDLITTPEQIAELLQKIKENHALLTVAIKGSEQYYSSALFRIDPENGYLFLDELVPKEGHIRLSHEMSLWVKTRLSGVMISFPATVENIDTENGIPYYKIPFPEAINYKQRREHHRVPIPRGHNIPVHLHTKQQRLVTGDLRNISLGGLCLFISRTASRGVRVGDIISRCVITVPDAITLPNTNKVTATIEIRNSTDQYPPNIRRIGGRFLELRKKDQQDIQQLVSALDRLGIRNLATGYS